MDITIIGLAIAALCFLGIIFLSAYNLRKLRNEENSLKNHVNQLREEEADREKDLATIKNLVAENLHKNELVEQEVANNERRKQDLNNDIADQVENIERLKSSFETTKEEFEKKYMADRKNWLDDRQAEYLQMQTDFVEQFREDNKRKLAAAQELNETLEELRSAVDSATEVAKRHAEKENFISFHSLQLAAGAKEDIARIHTILPSVSAICAEAIAKVIWKVYYEKAYTDMVGRVLGTRSYTGIYRITNSVNDMCYIGQAVDIADRWRQHIKRALGAEPRTQNKLYPAMYELGPENFTFEVVEECSREKLNEREDYWQDFYHAKEYGYSIK